jgi:hypothetical protein
MEQHLQVDMGHHQVMEHLPVDMGHLQVDMGPHQVMEHLQVMDMITVPMEHPHPLVMEILRPILPGHMVLRQAAILLRVMEILRPIIRALMLAHLVWFLP